jgi:hypothetical protein
MAPCTHDDSLPDINRIPFAGINPRSRLSHRSRGRFSRSYLTEWPSPTLLISRESSLTKGQRGFLRNPIEPAAQQLYRATTASPEQGLRWLLTLPLTYSLPFSLVRVLT